MSESKVVYENEALDIPIKVKNGDKAKRGQEVSEQLRGVVKEEHFWAALVHALGPLMIGLAVFADGLSWLGLIFITAGIYLYYSDKSALIKYHARQALLMQVIGTFGWFALFLSGTMIWVVLLVLSIILILLLVGIILTPLVAVAYPIFVLASFMLPLSVAIFGTIGAWETWHGREFRYPYLGQWLDQRFGGLTERKQLVEIV